MIQASNASDAVSVNDIAEECKGFFFAGKHSTSNLLTWTTVLLAMHPQWQVRARDEVLRVCGSRDVPTKDDLVKLKTVPLASVFFAFLFIYRKRPPQHYTHLRFQFIITFIFGSVLCI